MTREEAIELLCAYGVPQDENEFQEALDMAIKALGQEPCEDCVNKSTKSTISQGFSQGEPCEDCISREQTLKELGDYLAEYIPYLHGKSVMIPLECHKLIKQLPSVQPKPTLFIKAKDVDTEELEKLFVENPPVILPKTDQAEQFTRWVAREIFDENWEINKDSFAEIACRKLAKLGIVRAKGDEWELVEPQESEVEE